MTFRTIDCLWCACVLLLCNACGTTHVGMQANRKAIASRYFSALYGGDLSVIDELASQDIVVSYPIFQTLYNTPALRGRESVKRFATQFRTKWADARFIIEEVVEEGDRMAVVWSFQARNVGALRPSEPPDNQVHGWGGITLLRFDSAGRIAAEIGEESEPGPTERLHDDPVAQRD